MDNNLICCTSREEGDGSDFHGCSRGIRALLGFLGEEGERREESEERCDLEKKMRARMIRHHARFLSPAFLLEKIAP